METSNPDYIRREVTRVELVDLTDIINAKNVLLKEDKKPFKVVLSFNPEKGTLRVHFLELPEESLSDIEQ